MKRCDLPGLLAAMILAVAAPVCALEVIVDNSDPGCTVSGSWNVSTSSCYGANKLTHGPGTGTDSVTWTATLPAGWYRVDFRMNSNTTYSTQARYQITHRDGVENLVIDQQRASSTFFILGGVYYFDGAATVVLTDQFDASTGSLIIADAVRFWSVISFVQMSDSHIGYSRGNSNAQVVVNELKTLGKVTMATYGFDAPPPSFAIHSGDLTEYGQEFWQTAMNIFSGLPFPIYYALGNHDSTQNSNREKLRARHGGAWYSFDIEDRGTRYHFVTLNSSILQSPRAGFTREELDWLAADLAALPPNTPIFVNLHHPINGASDPKPYDAYRLLDVLRPYRSLIVFYGHGHNFSQTTFDNQRIVQGGSTYNDTTNVGGYNLICLTHGRIYIAKKVAGEATAATTLLNWTIPATPTYPTVTVDSPAKDAAQTGATCAISASISGASGAVTAVDFELDGDNSWRPLSGSGTGPYTGSLALSGLTHGRHWVRVRFTMDSGGPWYKMVPFWAWDAYPKARWIVDLGASSLSMPAVADGKVFAGANGGVFRCLDARLGAELWRVQMPSDIVSAPAVEGDRVVFGCGDGKVYCLSTETGSIFWSKTCSGPVYSPAAIFEGAVYIGSNGTGASNSAYLYSINLATGAENWKYAAGCAIESRPCPLSDTVYFGAWDGYFYAINRSTGALRWRATRNSNRYYSPADSWPVASATANRVFVADREYYLDAFNRTTGALDWSRTGVSSQALTPDGADLLIRLSAGTLDRINFSNTSTLWSRSCSLDSAPVAPVANGALVSVVDQDGLASVMNVSTGALQWQFQFARGYQLCPVNLDSQGALYGVTYDGFLVCAANQPPAPPASPDVLSETRDSSGALCPSPVYVEIAGPDDGWVNSAAKSLAPGLSGKGSRFTDSSTTRTAQVRITPDFPESGVYDLYVTWAPGGNANHVAWRVLHAEGETVVYLDQKPAGAPGGSNANTWVRLGQFTFNAGSSETSGCLIVDESTVTGPALASLPCGVSVDGFLWVPVDSTTQLSDWRGY